MVAWQDWAEMRSISRLPPATIATTVPIAHSTRLGGFFFPRQDADDHHGRHEEKLRPGFESAAAIVDQTPWRHWPPHGLYIRCARGAAAGSELPRRYCGKRLMVKPPVEYE